MRGQKFLFRTILLRNEDRAFWIHVPDSVEELFGWCFCECLTLSRVTFGESSFLKGIGKGNILSILLARDSHSDGLDDVLRDAASVNLPNIGDWFA